MFRLAWFENCSPVECWWKIRGSSTLLSCKLQLLLFHTFKSPWPNYALWFHTGLSRGVTGVIRWFLRSKALKHPLMIESWDCDQLDRYINNCFWNDKFWYMSPHGVTFDLRLANQHIKFLSRPDKAFLLSPTRVNSFSHMRNGRLCILIHFSGRISLGIANTSTMLLYEHTATQQNTSFVISQVLWCK